MRHVGKRRSKPDALLQGFLAVQVAEAATNYVHADEPLKESARSGRGSPSVDPMPVYDDWTLWRKVLDPERPAGEAYVDLYSAAVTEWVARIPGLYWHSGSERLRNVHPAQIESQSGRWSTYSPQGKSQLVSGGVGTLRFPPAEDGFRLVTVTSSHNASAGIPTLVSSDVWEYCNLAEGSVISIRGAPWRPMPQKWAEQFPVIRGIERGCLVLTDVAAVHVREQGAPVEAHPFSIMEYWDEDTMLHDFVYATADTSEQSFRRDLSTFFERYRNDKGREGTYLIASDIADPLWDATFADPAEMRASRGAQLRLIAKRAEEAVNGDNCIDALLHKLSKVETRTDLRRLSEKAGIPSRRWSASGISIGEEAARLVDVAVQSGKQQALLHTVVMELQ